MRDERVIDGVLHERTGKDDGPMVPLSAERLTERLIVAEHKKGKGPKPGWIRTSQARDKFREAGIDMATTTVAEFARVGFLKNYRAGPSGKGAMYILESDLDEFIEQAVGRKCRAEGK